MAEGDQDVAARLAALRREVEGCTRCRLHETRTQAVFGDGDPNAGLMFVGEAPGYHEDKQGHPFVGAAGKLLEELLSSIGLTRERSSSPTCSSRARPATVIRRRTRSRPAGPTSCARSQLIRPAVICSLGNFATKLLSGNQSGITKVHGVPQLHEVEEHRFYLYPIYHPAAALYTPAMLETLRADFFRLPQLISAPPPAVEAGFAKDVGGSAVPSVGAAGDAGGSSGVEAAGAADGPAGLKAPAGGARPAVAGTSNVMAFRGAAAASQAAEEEQLGLF